MSETCALAVIPVPDAYAFALSQPFVTAIHRRMLLAYRRAADGFLFLDDVVTAAGVASFRAINGRYGQLGHRVADLLDLRPAKYSPTSQRPLWTTALAEVGQKGPGRRWSWRLYPQVAAAIDSLGWEM